MDGSRSKRKREKPVMDGEGPTDMNVDGLVGEVEDLDDSHADFYSMHNTGVYTAGDLPDPSKMDWQGRIDLVRKSKNTVKHLGKPRAIRRASIGGKWTVEEDEALRAIVNEHGAKNWKNIARLLGPTRTDAVPASLE